MGRRWGIALACFVACGRTGLGPGTLASASGQASDGDDAPEEGPRDPEDDNSDGMLPPDEPRPDLGSQLPPPSTCPDPPAIPAGPSCEDPPHEQRMLFSSNATQAVLAVDDDAVYIIENGPEPTQLFRVDKCTGEAELLAAIGRNPANVIVVDDRVIWTDYDNPGHLYEVSLAGGDPIAIADVKMPLGLALADEWIFFSSEDGVFRLPRGGGTVEPWLDSTHWFVNLAYDGELVFGSEEAAGMIGWFDPLRGAYGGMVVEAYPGDVLADCSWLFWSDDYGLNRTDRATGTTDAFEIRVYRFVHDSSHVYASTGDTRVLAIDKQTGEAAEVGDVPGDVPWRIAIDETHVYWTSAKTGDLWVAPKP